MVPLLPTPYIIKPPKLKYCLASSKVSICYGPSLNLQEKLERFNFMKQEPEGCNYFPLLGLPVSDFRFPPPFFHWVISFYLIRCYENWGLFLVIFSRGIGFKCLIFGLISIFVLCRALLRKCLTGSCLVGKSWDV